MARCGWCGAKDVELDPSNDNMLKGHGKPSQTSNRACRGQAENYAVLIDKKGQSIFR